MLGFTWKSSWAITLNYKSYNINQDHNISMDKPKLVYRANNA